MPCNRLFAPGTEGVNHQNFVTLCNESVNQLRFLQEEAQHTGDNDLRAASYREMVQQHTMLLRSLDQAQLKQNGRRKEGE